MKYFKTKKYANEFMNGLLYMNSLGYFWKNGFESQRDMLEGVSEELKCKLILNNIEDFEKHRLTDYMIQYTGYQYCNLFCMTQLIYYPIGLGCINFDWSSKMESFGEYVVVITDEFEFLQRINDAMHKANLSYLCGDVEYCRAPFINDKSLSDRHHIILKTFDFGRINKLVYYQKGMDSFNKYDKFSWQKEWRICMSRNQKTTNAYTLNMSPIKDIAIMFKVKDFNKMTICSCWERAGKIQLPNFHGNISREELKKQLISLDQNQYVAYCAFG